MAIARAFWNGFFDGFGPGALFGPVELEHIDSVFPLEAPETPEYKLMRAILGDDVEYLHRSRFDDCTDPITIQVEETDLGSGSSLRVTLKDRGSYRVHVERVETAH